MAKKKQPVDGNGLLDNMQINPSEKKLVIKSAKIVDGITLDAKYHEQVVLISGTRRKDIGGSIARTGDNAVHDDLRAAFAKLNAHLGLLAEMVADEITLDDIDPKTYEDFIVTGFSIGGSGDNQGVTLTGTRMLSAGKLLNLVTPFEKWDGSEYKHIDKLAEAIQDCEAEVVEYLLGKMAPEAQQALDLDQTQDTFDLDPNNDAQ